MRLGADSTKALFVYELSEDLAGAKAILFQMPSPEGSRLH
jgi:hypothetical protein